MFKLSAIIASLAFIFSSWFTEFSVPRFLHSPGDYLIMPLFGYVMIIVAAQLAARITPEQQ